LTRKPLRLAQQLSSSVHFKHGFSLDMMVLPAVAQRLSLGGHTQPSLCK
jgi:hypothetical protein